MGLTGMTRFRRLLPVILVFVCTCADALEPGAMAKGTEPPPFSLKGIDGSTMTLADLRGKVVLVNFWASWCGPCITEIPSLRTLYGEMKGKPFELLAINVEESQFRVHKFTQLVEMPFPVLLDRDGKVFDSWNAQVLPTTYLLDQEGRIRYRVQGPADWSSAEVIDSITGLLPDTQAQ